MMITNAPRDPQITSNMERLKMLISLLRGFIGRVTRSIATDIESIDEIPQRVVPCEVHAHLLFLLNDVK